MWNQELTGRTRVLLVNPKTPGGTFWSYERVVKSALGKRTAHIPLGLITVAAMLSSEVFEIVGLVDENVRPLTDQHLLDCDMVMLGGMIVQRDSMRTVIARALALGKKVVVGGPYATTHTGDVSSMGADYVVTGEAEITLPRFTRDWVSGTAAKVYNEDLGNGKKPEITGTPIPRFDLLEIERYASMAAQYSRGCPYSCEFCYNNVLFGTLTRTKSPEQMIAELEALRQAGWRGRVFIVDDNFYGGKPSLRQLLPRLEAWQVEHNFPLTLFSESSIDIGRSNATADRTAMVRAGFTALFVGVESTDPNVLKQMKKGQNKGDLGALIRAIQASGLEVYAGAILGSDEDQTNASQKLFEFLQAEGIVVGMVGLLSALKGTPLHTRLKLADRLRRDSNGNNTHELSLNFEPVQPEANIIRDYVRVLADLYSAKNYYKRVRILMKRLGNSRVKSHFQWSELRALAVVLLWNIRRPNWYFLRLVGETLLTKPRQFTSVITHAVNFEHFRAITDDLVHEYALLQTSTAGTAK